MPHMFLWDFHLLAFIAPALILGIWAQLRISMTYAAASRQQAPLSGAAAARHILDSAGLHDVAIEEIPGHLSDHYDPTQRVLRLSTDIYRSPTLAAVGIAAHESGHALQHAQGYTLMAIRNAAVPTAQFGSGAGMFLLVLGVLFSSPALLLVGIIAFSGVVIFQIVNLPVEYDASHRAKAQLVQLGIVPQQEMYYVNRVLNAAALTYVAATLQSILTLLYYLSMLSGRPPAELNQSIFAGDERLPTAEPSGRRDDPAAQLAESAGQGIRFTLQATAVNVLLAATKIVAGALGRSHVLIADGVESVTDVVSSLVVTGGLRIAAIPPDKEHPYGHGKAESLAALVVSVALIGTAVGIAIQSVREVLGNPHEAPAVFTLYVLIGAIIAKEMMFRLLHRAGQSIGSEAVKTDAWHQRADAITSVAAFIGISVALIGGPGYEQADGWAALVACLVIAYNGVRLFRRALDEMMDRAPPPEIEAKIRRIAGQILDVAAIEKCRVRRSGLSLFVDIHVEVDGNLTVRRGHEIAHDVKQALLDAGLAIIDVTVHIEPASDSKGDKVTR